MQGKYLPDRLMEEDQMTVWDAMAWLLSATSALMLWLMGNKSKWGPRLGIFNQVLWLAYAIGLRQWGLLPGIVLYTFVHMRNLYKWRGRQ
jgi:hypothetical protein